MTASTPETAQEKISRRALEIWEEEGRPEGRALEHWLRAESELARQSSRKPESASEPRKGPAVPETSSVAGNKLQTDPRPTVSAGAGSKKGLAQTRPR